MSLPTPAGLVWWRPAALVATGFGVGHLPWVPGSWGSLAALLCGWEIVEAGDPPELSPPPHVASCVCGWAPAALPGGSGQADSPLLLFSGDVRALVVFLRGPAA